METPPSMGAPVPHESGSRPMIGFHLGIALLLVAVFTLTGIFSLYYHWDRIRRSLSLRAAEDGGRIASNTKPVSNEESLPVIMPGDEVPKFIALTCPLEPPRPLGDVVVEVRRPPPPKPPLAGVPFYALIGPY